MALYRHVPSKDGAVDLMLDEVTARSTLPEAPGDDWRADLRAIALSSWEMARDTAGTPARAHPPPARAEHAAPH